MTFNDLESFWTNIKQTFKVTKAKKLRLVDSFLVDITHQVTRVYRFHQLMITNVHKNFTATILPLDSTPLGIFPVRFGKITFRFVFYRAAYSATHGIAVAILSVRPSVCQMRVL